MIPTGTIAKWLNFCSTAGWMFESQAAKLGLTNNEYRTVLQGGGSESVVLKMTRIMEGRDILDRAILKTELLKEVEKYVIRCKNEHIIATLAAPTGQGKTVAAKYLSRQHECRYFQILTDMEKKKVAAKGQFVRDIGRLFSLKETPGRNLWNVITGLQSDTRQVLIIDEAQRLISEDWGYFKVLQDLFDNVPSLSILMVGNYRFYNDMFTDSDTTYKGVSDPEQFLRRISEVKRLPRVSKNDIKLWSDYHGLSLKNNELIQLAEYFSRRAGLSDLENVRKEIVRIMGQGKIKEMSDVSADILIAVYKGLHTKIREGASNEIQKGKIAEQNVA